MRSWRLASCGVLAGAIFATVATSVVPVFYTSQVTFAANPRLPPVQIDMGALASKTGAALKRRTVLMPLIQSHNLYPGDRRRLTMEETLQTFVDNIAIHESDGSVTIAFRYFDQLRAQTITGELADAFIDEFLRQDPNSAVSARDAIRKHEEEELTKLLPKSHRIVDRWGPLDSNQRQALESGLKTEVAVRALDEPIREQRRDAAIAVIRLASPATRDPEWKVTVALSAVAGFMIGSIGYFVQAHYNRPHAQASIPVA